jgi:phage recombination protein Bet
MSASSELVKYEADGQAIQFTADDIRNFLVSGDAPVSNKEIRLFMELCKARGLNPWIKEAYLVKYSQKDPATMITGKYVHTKRAAAHKDCAGWQSGVITETTTGEMKFYKGTVFPKSETLLGGWIDIFRHNWKEPLRKTVSLSEYVGLRYNKDSGEMVPTKLWKEKPATMIEKVAIVAGLREAFPDALGDLYSAEEVEPGSTEPREAKVEPANQQEAAGEPSKRAGNPPAQAAEESITTDSITPEEKNAFYRAVQKTGLAIDAYQSILIAAYPDNIEEFDKNSTKFVRPSFSTMTREVYTGLMQFIQSNEWKTVAKELGITIPGEEMEA